MKVLQFAAIVALIGHASGALALDLPARVQNKQDSLEGRPLDLIRNEVDAKAIAGKPTLVQLTSQFVARGFAEPKGVTTRWQESRDDVGRRGILARIKDSAEGPIPYQKSMDEYRTLQRPLDYPGLAARAAQVAAVAYPIAANSAEQLVPDAVRHMSVGVGKVSGGKPEELTVATMVILRRHISGVPVLGSGGEVRIMFDVDGTLTEVDVPLYGYQVAEAAPRSVQTGRARTGKVLQSGAFAGAPARAGETVLREGHEVRVDAVECGYYDDGVAPRLKRGCIVQWISKRGADRQFVEDRN